MTAFISPSSRRRWPPVLSLPPVILCAALVVLPLSALAQQAPCDRSPTRGAFWTTLPPYEDVTQVDLKRLEQRLRRTGAVGLFTKLSLKREIDDLIRCFKRFHSHGDVSVAELRARFNALFERMGALLRHGDRGLYRDLFACREQLWVRLVDPVGFRGLVGERHARRG